MAYKVTIGVAPLKRSFLSMETAYQQKLNLMKVIEKIRPDDIRLVTIDDICENGVMYKDEDVEKVVEKFKAEKVDALFLAHMDFGEEKVGAGVAQALKLPTLLWGARDEYPNTMTARGRDTQCGMFACSKVLRRAGIKYTYIFNCRVTDHEFAEGYENFARAVSAVKSVKDLKILKIGARPESFMSVMADEPGLLNRFGIGVIPVSPAAIVERAKKLAASDDAEFEAYYKDVSARIDMSSLGDKARLNAALTETIRRVMTEKGCACGALECWSAFGSLCVVIPCMAVGELADRNLPLSCETDVMGAVTLSLLKGVSFGETAPFFADLTIRHPENDNAELLWHCGPFPYSLKREDQKAEMCDSNEHWELKKGHITIARMDEAEGEYYLFSGEGNATDGPETNGTYVWLETDDWRKWEYKLMYGPYIHHVGGMYGSYGKALEEAARYLDVKFDKPE